MAAGVKGYGLYASEKILSGQFVCEYIGIITQEQEVGRPDCIPQPTLQCLESPALYIDSSEYGDASRFIKRARPNSCVALQSRRCMGGFWTPAVDIMAVSDIEIGGEITLEHKKTFFSEESILKAKTLDSFSI